MGRDAAERRAQPQQQMSTVETTAVHVSIAAVWSRWECAADVTGKHDEVSCLPDGRERYSLLELDNTRRRQ
jgi:hypothetical protein